MAGQKREAQTSILRRVLDLTPLRPARLEKFQPEALKTARFAARYFNREAPVIQRLLNIGDIFSPLRRTIGRDLVSRYTNFNQSFGPVQRALRPQPEHQPRRRQHAVDEGYEGEAFESFEPEDYGYSPEPAFFNPPELPLSQNFQPDYPGQTLAALPWEQPVIAAPLPVARRIEFQPANLQYLRNPEKTVPARPMVDGPVEAVVERTFVPIPANPAPSQPNRPVEPARQPGVTPAQPASSGLQSAPEPGVAESIAGYREPNFNPQISPARMAPALPALSRALERTFDATLPQTGVSTPAFNQGANLGASPEAVARHFAVPATLARYRAVKQAADKAIFGEEAATSAGFPSEPALSPTNFVTTPALPVVTAVSQPGSAAGLPEIRRIQKDAGLASEPTFNPTTTANLFTQPQQPSQGQSHGATPVQGQAEQAQVQGKAQSFTGQTSISPEPAAAVESNRTGLPGSYQAVSSPVQPLVTRTFQPDSVQIGGGSGLTRSLAEPVLFDEAIPASLLENTSPAYEPRRLSGGSQALPVVARTWANTLGSLRNNPGIEAHPPLARQLNQPADEVPRAEPDGWSGGGAGVFYDQRRPRRVETALADIDAAETQDRIFSLAETNPGPASFKPQFMQALAAEAVTPAQPVVNRSLEGATQAQPSSPSVRDNFSGRPVYAAIQPAQPPISREIETAAQGAAPEIANIRPGVVPVPIQPERGQQDVAQVNQLEPATETVLPAEDARDASSLNAAASGGLIPPVQRARETSLSPAVETSEISGEAVSEPTSLTPGQTILETGAPGQASKEAATAGDSYRIVRRPSGPQPTALQRAFKRLDLDEPGSSVRPVSGNSSGFDFDALSFSYAARPGSYPHRPGQPAESADFLNFIDSVQGGYPEAAYPAPIYAQPQTRETVVERITRAQETSAPQAPADNNLTTPASDREAPEARVITRPSRASQDSDPARIAGDTRFEGLSVPDSGQTPAITGTTQPFTTEVARLSQPQYFSNSLEATWLSPENRLFVERLPGGSSALQRLRQAPGQLSAFLEQFQAASTPGLTLPSLINNPGLSNSVARALENTGPDSGTPVINEWSGGPALNFALRRRSVRQAQESLSENESGSWQEGYFGFEPAPAASNPETGSLPGSTYITTEAARTSSAPVNRPDPLRPVTAQPVNFQNNANRETTARIQRSSVADPAQPASTPGFTITNNWVAELQRRFAGISVGQLSDATGQVMRFLNNEGAGLPGTGFGFNPAPDFGSMPGFSYTVPPLLWRKVGDYAPHNNLPLNPAQTGNSQAWSTFTSPGEVLRAYEEGQTYPGLPDEDVARPAETVEQSNQARLELPRLEQTHLLLQRISSLEKTNMSLELAHRMEAAARPDSSTTPAKPGVAPQSLPRPVAIQRQPDLTERPVTRFSSDLEAAKAVEERSQPAPAPLRMTDVPANRPTADNGNFEAAEPVPDQFTDDGFAHPAPEIRTIEVRVPDHRNYPTPLEAAAARSGSNGPNIGQGEILQPLAIQRKASAESPAQAATYAPLAQPALHNLIKTSVGRTLEHQVQRKMTGIFGAHFQDVRVHTGEEAAQATRQVGAEAFTLGSNIYFAPGRYQPESLTGQALIGHELTHVIQQSSLPSLGGGRIPETSGMGQTFEHHAIANEQLLLRHLSNNHDDHDHHNHGFSSDEIGRLSYQNNHSASSYNGATATVERSYQPVSEQNSHPPIKPAHLRNDFTSGAPVQRVIGAETQNDVNTSGSQIDVNEMISNQENMDRLAQKVYQIIRDKLLIERERGFGPGNGKFF